MAWARERSGFTRQVAAKKLGVAPETLAAWESEEERPTFSKALSVAKKLHIPFGYLFLSQPPIEEIPLPDLRTVGNAPPQSPSTEFLDLVYDVLRKQGWYHDFLREEGSERAPFVGRFDTSAKPDAIAQDIASTLGINDELRSQAANWETFLTLFVQRAELAGVVVMRSGVVAGNSHRPLDVDEFRGFAISDNLAPLVFVNGQDAKTAQIFTLAHELAHLWLGATGVSNPDLLSRASEQPNPIDRLCDQVAAEVLVPKQQFLSDWDDAQTIDGNLRGLSSKYRVSKFVVLRRAYENSTIDRDEYREYYKALVDDLRGRKRKGGGGDFYSTLLARNSSNLTFALLAASAEGRVSDRDAAALLNVKIQTVVRVRERLIGAGPRAP